MKNIYQFVKIIILSCLLSSCVYAQEYLNDMKDDKTPVLNEELRKLRKDVRSNSSSCHSVPAGGTTNQVLVKNSNSDYDVKWVDMSVVVSGIFGTLNAQEGIYDSYNGGTAATDLIVYGWIDGNALLHITVNSVLIIHLDPMHAAVKNPIPAFAVKKGETWSITWDHTPAYIYIMPVGS